jgi:superfamily II DNA or RNA helicase
MLNITLTNSKSRIEGPEKIIHKLHKNEKEFAIRAAGAFFAPSFRNRSWDGMVRYISEAGYFETGLFPKIVEYLKRNKLEFKVTDNRDRFEYDNIPRKLGNDILRDYQGDALSSVVNNIVDNIPFPRGIIGAATNAGKTIIIAGIFKAYNKPTILLLNSKDLFVQALGDMNRFLPGRVGQISADKTEWNEFMICMVPTMSKRIDKIKSQLAKFEVCLVDECDLSTSKSYTGILKYLYNCYVKVGLSGSPFKHKDKNKNEKIRCLFGDVIYTINNKVLIERGFSAPVKVRIIKGNETIKLPGDYEGEVKQGIILNKDRNNTIKRRAKYHYKYKRFPMLIITKHHKHIDILYRKLKTLGINVKSVHHKTPDRQGIIQDFKDGKIDILVGSMILKRGMNFPLMKYILNAGGGDSIPNVLQILGRATRRDDSKTKTVLEDFFDQGAYIQRHSKHRIKCYKDEGLEVVEEYK